ncbi:hypothetical protein GDO86_006905 [Hymenochirus boettgeri]|uniref:Uncharacterized protein n=1 Tax=Hymenochirus boettgeri TaxID=247094 RepID=A0A8T2JCQ2_9PIPI|nr:hypothetical protein GDO86_006905 [Hymenochirus boettgeri]
MSLPACPVTLIAEDYVYGSLLPIYPLLCSLIARSVGAHKMADRAVTHGVSHPDKRGHLQRPLSRWMRALKIVRSILLSNRIIRGGFILEY